MLDSENREDAINILTNQFINSIKFSEIAEILIKEGRARAIERVDNMNEKDISNLIQAGTQEPEETRKEAESKGLWGTLKDIFKIDKKAKDPSRVRKRFKTSK
jgi:endonuclease YncB( thermonuclease family)